MFASTYLSLLERKLPYRTTEASIDNLLKSMNPSKKINDAIYRQHSRLNTLPMTIEDDIVPMYEGNNNNRYICFIFSSKYAASA